MENREMIRLILKMMNKPADLAVNVGDRKGHDKRYAINFSKAQQELGYQPKGNFLNDLQTTVDWYINNQVWWKPLKSEADKIAQFYLKQIN
jgi:dTDP-glucose 4,6-dehydratase